MKERPILFSAPMVRAILAGRKTQTRRAVRKQFAPDADPAEVPASSPEGWQITGHSGLWWDDAASCFDDAIKCPYGQPGDRLWVRETWQGPLLEYAGDYQRVNRGLSINNPEHCVYRATDKMDAVDDDGKELGWRPSIHMPRWASRILLEITGVRVERLNDISEADSAAEGLYHDGDIPFNMPWFVEPEDVQGYSQAKDCYSVLWEQINGAGSWDANPWVYVVEFKRVMS